MVPDRSDPGAEEFLPARLSLASLGRAAAKCKGCHLYKKGNQTVFGQGLRRSRLMLVGEMPGDQEDKQGKPFVGPAGKLLDRALEEAGIDRTAAYITNVVKHFKWEKRGTRRLHRTPNASEIKACLPWLDAEIEVIEPEVIVCLGATAARALIGSDFRVTRQHGAFVESDLAPHVTATVHPSAILRSEDDEARQRAMDEFVKDLEQVERVLNGG